MRKVGSGHIGHSGHRDLIRCLEHSLVVNVADQNVHRSVPLPCDQYDQYDQKGGRTSAKPKGFSFRQVASVVRPGLISSIDREQLLADGPPPARIVGSRACANREIDSKESHENRNDPR